MEMQIQDLVQSIKRDGIEEARKEADAIVAAAKAQADEIIAASKAQAEKNIESANREIESSKALIKQAERDAVLSVKKELALVIDPMLATGGSACDAVMQLKKLGYKRIKFLNLISAPEGIAKFESEHPDVPVYTAAKDERLNSHYYIVPGLGDAGDRIFGTL